MPHKGGKVLNVGRIRLKEEGCWLTKETRWILYHNTILYSLYVIMMMLPYFGPDSLHDL